MFRDHRIAGNRMRGVAALGGFLLVAGPVLAQGGPASPPPGQIGSGSVASTPGAAPSQQPGSALPPVYGQARTAAQALRTARQQLLGGGAPNFGMARTAVAAGRNALDRLPEQTTKETAHDAARLALVRADRLLGQPDPQLGDLETLLQTSADALDMLAGYAVQNQRQGSLPGGSAR